MHLLLRSLVCGILVSLGLAGSAHAASLTLSAPAVSPEDTAVAVSASGTIEAGRSLYVRVLAGDATCGATAAVTGGTSVIVESYFSPATLATSGTYTPADPETYTACGFIATSAAAAPTAVDRVTFTARRTTATLALSVSADPVEDRAVTVIATGTMEVARSVYVRVLTGDVGCPATAAEAAGTSVIVSTYYSVATISDSGSYTPSDPGSYTACGYVAASTSAPADGSARAVFAARRAKATLDLGVPGDAMDGKRSTITATGTMEVARSLYVRILSGAVGCPATAAGAAGTSAIVETYYSVQPIASSGSFTPSGPGSYTACGYVAASTSATPDAAARAVFSAAVNPDNPTRSPGDPDAPVTGPGLIGPANAVSGEQLNPTFTWTADPVLGVRYDRVRVSRDERDGRTTKLVDITYNSAVSYLDVDDEADKGTELKVSDVARVVTRDGQISVTLKTALSPGTYSWFVLRSKPGRFEDDPDTYVASERRRFTVLGPKLTKLSSSSRSSVGRTSTSPGYTTIKTRTSPFARVRYAIRRQGRSAAVFSRADKAGRSDLTIPWNCKRAGGTYRVSVDASDQFGTHRKTSLHFRPVSRARCASMRRAEARARRIAAQKRAARQRAADRRYAQRQAALERAEAQAQARRLQRFQDNCRAIGGSPAVIDTDDGPYTVCRSPIGGTLPVPGT